MSLLNSVLGSVLNDQIANKIAQSTGMSQEQSKKAVEMAMPMLMGALANNTSNTQGAESLDKALEQHDGSILENIDISSLLTSDDGQKIIGHILGNKTSKAEEVIAKETGADNSQIASILKIAGPLLMGALSKEKKEQGLDLSGLTSLLLNEKKSAQSDSNSIQNMIFDFIDQNDDGSVVDDIIGFATKMMKK